MFTNPHSWISHFTAHRFIDTGITLGKFGNALFFQ
ncbi:hypothetical protein LINPERHAP2_LOCUS24367 [Linum perenne]